MRIDLAGGGRLLLAGAGQAWVWLLLGAVVLVLLLVLYREERKLVSRRAGLMLLTLRLSAAGVLVFALFEPIAAWTRVETVRGKLVVAADSSESMSTIDPGRLDGRSRREIARRLIDGEAAPLSKLAGDHDLATLAFAREGTPGGPLDALARSLGEPSRSDDPARLTSDPLSAFNLALNTPDDRPVTGVVLLTDGRFNGPTDFASALDRLKARGVPVFPVLIGSTLPPKDVAIAGVKAPDTVYKGDLATIDVMLKTDGLAVGTSVEVTLSRPGSPILKKTVLVPAEGVRPLASFRVPLEQVGAIPISVAVTPPPGDARSDNDSRAITVQVADDKASVLLVDGEARWEFRYLRNALTRDPRVKLEAVLLHQPTPVGSIEATYPTSLPPRPADAAIGAGTNPSASPDPLARFDLIVLGDLSPADLSTETWDRLVKFVGERGGTLVISPGPRGWPAALGTSDSARALAPLIDPKPIRAEPGDDPAHPSLPPGVKLRPVASAIDDAGAWPMLQLGADSALSRSTWDTLPRLPWAIGGAAKPSATVLLTAGDGSAVVAAQPFGLGKVLWVGTDATWRWRLGVGDLHHHRFWGQVVRWAASAGLGAGDRSVRFGPIRAKVGEGEPAVIRARISEGVPDISTGFLVAARIHRVGTSADKGVAVVPLRAVPGQSRTFEGVAPSLPEGAYLIRLDAPGLPREPGAAPLEASLTVTNRETPERVELSAAREPLERLAAATGGKVFDESTVKDLPKLLKSRVKTETKTEETPLWDHPVGLLLFFAVLTCEWILRRRVGLP